MEKRFLFSMVMAAMMMGACTDEVPNGGENGGGITGGGDGYISLSLNLPSEPSSRANDNFDDGLPSEYEVKDGTLILFTGGSEAEAKFHSAYNLDLKGWNMEGTPTDQVTTSAKIVQLVDGVKSSTNKVYALVVLNHNGVLSVDNDGGLKVNNIPLTVGSSTMAAFTETALTPSSFTGNGILMANTPLSGKIGGTTDPSTDGTNIFTLAEIDKSKIYNTEGEAMAKPAASIYVERAVAKVTVNAAGNNAADNGFLKYSLTGWDLDQTNKKSYLVRNVTGVTTPAITVDWWGYKSAASTVDNYRFVGGEVIDSKYYRTYWGIDPNYNKTYTLPGDATARGEEFTILTGGSNEFQKASGAVAYCLENTFDVAQQDQNQTTRVIVKVQLDMTGAETDKTFYTWNGDESTIYNETNAQNLMKDAFMSSTDVQKWIQENIESTTPSDVLEEGDLNFIYGTNGTSYVLTEIELTNLADFSFKGTSGVTDNKFPSAVIDDANASAGTIKKYDTGYAYYPILIKHFGDDLTPWNTWEDGTANPKPDKDNIYPGDNAAQNYLGRYGVLRNNWYDITVTGIKRIGYASVGEIPVEGKDDSKDEYISVDINILSWAKRTQEVEL